MLYRLQPAVVAAQTFSTLDRHAVNDVVDQPAVELVEVIEPAAAESGQSAAKQTQPDVAGAPVHIDRGHGLERQPVFLLPAPDLAGPFVVAGQAILGADPHFRSIGLHGEDMVAGQAVSHGEMLPFRINKRQCICGNLRDLGGRQCRHFQAAGFWFVSTDQAAQQRRQKSRKRCPVWGKLIMLVSWDCRER